MPSIITRGGMSAKAFGLTGSTASPVYVEDVFSTYLYTGNGSTQTITNNIDLSTKGGLVWFKQRNTINGGAASLDHYLLDTARGGTQVLASNNTNASAAQSSPYVTFNNSGFTLSGTTSGSINYAGSPAATFASWTFRKQPKFFDVVTYTGNGVTGRTVNHNLGASPGMIIVKCTSDGGTDWLVYHKSLGGTQGLFLDTTGVAITSTTFWNDTDPTSLIFTVGDNARVNQNNWSYVAYLFADQAGGFGLSGSDSVVACGSFTTDGSGNATVNLGWEPQFILKKASSAAENWDMFDIMRGMPAAPGLASALRPNLSNAETGAIWGVNPTATGFTVSLNVSTTYIYLAIRRGPMKVPTSGTSVFSPIVSSALAGSSITTGFPVDTQFWYGPDSSYALNPSIIDRLRGVSNTDVNSPFVRTSTTQQEGSYNFVYNWGNTGFQVGTGISGLRNLYYNFLRAPGFFDEVCYAGTGVATTQAHNLGVVPELIIVKPRSAANPWLVYAAPVGATNSLVLSGTQAAFSASYWNNTAPTSTVFSIGSGPGTNQNGETFVAYLFATCPGVSKVGSYTGTGAAQNIDCGFAAGARFVLIKRTDSTGDWYTYDSARGISSGNDPYFLMNSTAAEVTGTNYVDAFASGFTLTASAPAGLNANGGSYIFLAIA